MAKRTPRVPLMAGNWKMNLDHQQAAHLVQKLDWTLKDAKHDFGGVEVAVLPPFTDLRTVQTLVEGDHLEIRYGAQDLSVARRGRLHRRGLRRRCWPSSAAPTSLVGHSERREYHGEDDAEVERQGARPRCGTACAPIAVRRRGPAGPPGGRAGRVHRSGSSTAALEGVSADQGADLVVAYEPVWAIGTGEVATPEDAQEVCAAIRRRLGRALVDGAGGARPGCCTAARSRPGNIAAIMAQTDVDGALVGGASLQAEEFAAICRYRDHVTGSVSG